MTKEQFLKKILEEIDEFTELKGDDLLWIGGALIGEGFSRVVHDKFGVKLEDLKKNG